MVYVDLKDTVWEQQDVPFLLFARYNPEAIFGAFSFEAGEFIRGGSMFGFDFLCV